ncbi:hypothetical Protein YC6258_01739 [Gynuella sunshinyii YC6258]|uniref:Uncharacterized protein n=1 Tax=Gynuella sunshinyii YC6258 TaxID=1445510 RepID=A0A0C5VK94_9GAMM|nr:hypothetical Protein YC6258_01739 [Gynuella sunshinyii YC6258]
MATIIIFVVVLLTIIDHFFFAEKFRGELKGIAIFAFVLYGTGVLVTLIVGTRDKLK